MLELAEMESRRSVYVEQLNVVGYIAGGRVVESRRGGRQKRFRRDELWPSSAKS